MSSDRRKSHKSGRARRDSPIGLTSTLRARRIVTKNEKDASSPTKKKVHWEDKLEENHSPSSPSWNRPHLISTTSARNLINQFI